MNSGNRPDSRFRLKDREAGHKVEYLVYGLVAVPTAREGLLDPAPPNDNYPRLRNREVRHDCGLAGQRSGYQGKG